MSDKEISIILSEYQLTNREQEIAVLWVKDYSYKQIAVILFLSEHTIRTVIKNIHQKVRVNSKASLIIKVLGN